jgi:hypothetical protein
LLETGQKDSEVRAFTSFTRRFVLPRHFCKQGVGWIFLPGIGGIPDLPGHINLRKQTKFSMDNLVL